MSVKLCSSDNQVIETPRDVIKMFGLIDNMMEDIGGGNETIPVPTVRGLVLDKIIQFCQYHTNHPEIDINSYLKTITIDKWDTYDVEFCTKPDIPTLIEILKGADYLDVTILRTLLVKYNANLILGKTRDEIKQIYSKPSA